MAESLDLEDRTLTVHSGEIFTAAFLQVLSKIMLKLALDAELALFGREFVEECPRAAKRSLVA